MAPDDISTPLGVDLEAKRTKRKAWPFLQMAAGAAALLTVSVIGYAVIAHDPLGGEPYAVASIVKVEKPAERIEAAAVTQPAGKDLLPPPPEEEKSAAEQLEEESGIKVHRGKGGNPSAVIIQVPDANEAGKPAAPDRSLTQSSRHGVLPVIGADGRRPLDVYARPVSKADAGKSPRVAIVMGGLGIGQSVTSRAIKSLPGPVTLAFAPYGSDLGRQISRAREGGHEIMLHAPMEPFDYPDNDPGPQTLVSGQKQGTTQDRLYWLMSRFQGYVGVMNFMGARFMASEKDFQLVAQELSQRGLAFLHDGSVKDDGAVAQIRASGGQAGGADVMIDLIGDPKSIDQALERLEEIAREKGSAIGVASALPVSIDRLEIWTKSLSAKGITLVPVSAMLR
jgi:uncharacterized protein